MDRGPDGIERASAAPPLRPRQRLGWIIVRGGLPRPRVTRRQCVLDSVPIRLRSRAEARSRSRKLTLRGRLPRPLGEFPCKTEGNVPSDTSPQVSAQHNFAESAQTPCFRVG